MRVDLLTASVAALGYVSAAAVAARAGRPALPALIAIACHGLVLASGLIHERQLTVGVTEAFSLFSWQAAVLLWFYCLVQDLRALTLGVYPVAGLAALVAATWPSSVTAIPLGDWKLQLHVLLSLLSAGFLTLAAAQAVMLAIQDRRLHGMVPAGATGLPPIQTMESLLFQLIGIGFFMLSLSLATGLLFVDNLMAQHLAHKTALTLLAWVIFGGLLLGRWRAGWRGRTALRWALSGYAVLILGYFGSKLVLELILHRHWT